MQDITDLEFISCNRINMLIPINFFGKRHVESTIYSFKLSISCFFCFHEIRYYCRSRCRCDNHFKSINNPHKVGRLAKTKRCLMLVQHPLALRANGCTKSSSPSTYTKLQIFKMSLILERFSYKNSFDIVI